MTTLLRSKDRCPHAYRISAHDPGLGPTGKVYESPDFCNLNDKPCILETCSECVIWKEIQDECNNC